MKTIYFAAILFFLTLKVIAQDFAPLGAKWYYTEEFAFSGDVDFLLIQSVKDTIILNKNCRELNCEALCWNKCGLQYVYSSNDSVFFYDDELDKFQLLYFFSDKINDTWYIQIYNWDESMDTFKVNVDSIYTVSINDEVLRAYDVTYTIKEYSDDFDLSYSSKVIEKIGDTHYLFYMPEETRLLCDENFSRGLRCYEDSQFGLYSTGIADSCNYTYKWISNVEDNTNDNFILHINSTNENIQIKVNFQEEVIVELRNLYGGLIQSKIFTWNTNLDITGLSKGIYLLAIKCHNKLLETRKIIKY